MRLRRSGQDDDASTATADFVLQLGAKKVPIKAEKLLGATVKVSTGADRDQQDVGEERTSEEEVKIIEEFARMRKDCTSGTTPNGQWTPWSPDDLYLYTRQLSRVHPAERHQISELPAQEVPNYYDPAEHLHPASRHASASTFRDRALHKAPTVFDNLGEAPPSTPEKDSIKQYEVSRRSRTHGHSSRPKRLDLVQYLPHSSQQRPYTTNGRLVSPSTLTHSPSAVTGRPDPPLPPLPTEAKKSGNRRSNTVGATGKKNFSDDTVLDSHKTHVRRPPKGIQNWFDAYLESEDDEEGEDEDDTEKPLPRHPQEPEPQELPADEVPLPAYTAPTRAFSRISEKSTERYEFPDPRRELPAANEQSTVEQEMERYRDTSESNSWDSIQSSHIGRIAPEEVIERTGPRSLTGQSVLSLSESSIPAEEDEDEDEEGEEDEDEEEAADEEEEKDESEVHGSLLPIRDSIVEDRDIEIGAASSIGMQKVERRPRLQKLRNSAAESKESLQSARSAKSLPSPTQTRASPLPTPPRTAEIRPTADAPALQRLNGLSVQSGTSASGDTVFQDVAEVSPVDASHMMAVTDEEKMLLDLMRRKRAAMQQLSFTEGYQLALKTEQQRFSQSTFSAAGHSAVGAKKKKGFGRRESQVSSSVASPARSQSEADVRRQLSAIRKEQVDETFQIERFLRMSLPHHGREDEGGLPAELANNRASAELLPSTVYSPTFSNNGSRDSPLVSTQEAIDELDQLDSVSRKVQYFIATNGAVPPFNTFKMMRKQSNRPIASSPPSPVFEEEQSTPNNTDIPAEEPVSGTLSHKFSSVSMDDEPRDKSPIYPPTRNDSGNHLPPPKYNRAHTSPTSSPKAAAIVSHATSLPQLSSSPASPFSHIISAASGPKPVGNNISRQQTLSPSANSSETDVSVEQQLPAGVTRVLQPPRQKTVEHMESRSSLYNAENEILAAWADLGGGQSCLKGKNKAKRPSTSAGHS